MRYLKVFNRGDFLKRDKIILAMLIVMILALFIGASSAFSLFGKQATQLNITNDDTISPGDKITINLTKDGKGIANATINITITNDNGLNETNSTTTIKKGIATFKFDKDAGNYVINCTYAGDNDNKASNATKNITVKVEETNDDYSDDSDSYQDDGAIYSEQYGGMVYTGEIHAGPDGNYYKHLGYNEWVQV